MQWNRALLIHPSAPSTSSSSSSSRSRIQVSGLQNRSLREFVYQLRCSLSRIPHLHCRNPHLRHFDRLASVTPCRRTLVFSAIARLAKTSAHKMVCNCSLNFLKLGFTLPPTLLRLRSCVLAFLSCCGFFSDFERFREVLRGFRRF